MPAYSLTRIRCTFNNLYLVHRPGEALLVDSGPEGSETEILRQMEKQGLEPSMLRFLLLTHTHFDHAGSAAAVKEATGCKVLVHKDEAGRLRSGSTPFPSGTRWKAKVVAGLGRTLRRRIMDFPPLAPDLTTGSFMDLGELGFPGRILHMPGHTPGSLVVLLEGGELLCGDTLIGRKGKKHFPPFAEDPDQLDKSWKALHAMEGYHSIYPAHGHPIPRESFEKEFTARTDAG